MPELQPHQFHHANVVDHRGESQATRAYRGRVSVQAQAQATIREHLEQHGRHVEGKSTNEMKEIHRHEHAQGHNVYGDPLGHNHV